MKSQSVIQTKDGPPGDSLHGFVRGISADIEMAKTWSSDYLAADRGYGHGWRPVSYRLAVELEKCRASLGAIHYHASRGSIEWPRVILLSIKEEAEHCIPALGHISAND